MQGHYGNGFSLRNEYDEDGYDDYEVDGIEDEVDSAEENEEEPKPNEEELEFLKLREQLSALAFGLLNQSQDRKRTVNDKTLVALLDASLDLLNQLFLLEFLKKAAQLEKLNKLLPRFQALLLGVKEFLPLPPQEVK